MPSHPDALNKHLKNSSRSPEDARSPAWNAIVSRQRSITRKIFVKTLLQYDGKHEQRTREALRQRPAIQDLHESVDMTSS